MYKSVRFNLSQFLIYGDGLLIGTARSLPEAYEVYQSALSKFKNVTVSLSESVTFDVE